MARLFGTDGVRGISGETLRGIDAYTIGRAVAAVCAEKRAKNAGSGENRIIKPRILIGCDTRISSDMLKYSLIGGLCAGGADAIDIGVVPTPAVSYIAAHQNADMGVMITASHNTYEYNGIKLIGKSGGKASDETEDRVEYYVKNPSSLPREATFDEIGRVMYDGASNSVGEYISFLSSKGCDGVCLDGLRVVLDCANGAVSGIAARVFMALGATVRTLNANPDGTNTNKNCGSTNPDTLSEYMKAHTFDIGAAFDGDGDRCLCVDENGSLFDGDKMLALFAADAKRRGELVGNTVVGTVMSNMGLEAALARENISFIRTAVGDKYVVEGLDSGGFSLGGEQSGHIIFRKYAATGDGLLTALRLCAILIREGKPLSALGDVMKQYPQYTLNVRILSGTGEAVLSDGKIKKAISEAELKLKENGGGRILVRPSGTEPLIRVMTECEDDGSAATVAKDIASVITQTIKN